MTTRIESLGLLAALVLMSFVFQYQLKILANEVGPILATVRGPFATRAVGLLSSIAIGRVLLVLALALALFLVWFLMLTRLELSVALPISSITIVINTIGNGMLLGEDLSTLRICGVLLISVGIAMVLKS